MLSVSERERGLILDLLRNRIQEEEFYLKFPVKPGEVSAVGLAMLREALRKRDPVGVEFGLYLGHRFGISQDYLDVLNVLAGEDWHQRHEDVVAGLAKLKSPTSVDALYRTAIARYPYLEYDEAYTLGVQSIFALGKIGTREAVLRLRDLMHSGNEVIESEAKLQLSRLTTEGRSESVREFAREVLAASS